MKVLPRRRAAVLVNSALGVALLGTAALAYATVNGGSSAAAAKTQTRTATVAKGTVLATVSGSGALASPGDAGEDFVTGGKVTSIKVAVGDSVVKGEVLATVDQTAAQQQVDAAQSALATAQANLTKAEAGTTTVTHAVDTGSGGGVVALGDATGTGTVRAAGLTSTTPAQRPTAGASPSASQAPTPGQSQGGAPAPRPTVTVTVTQPPAAGRDSTPSPQPSPSTTTTVDPAQVAQAQQQLQTAQTNLGNAQAALAGTTLVADTDGTVASIGGKVGDTVSGGSTGSTGSAGSSGAASSGKSGGSSGGSSSGSGAPSGFIVLTNPSGMQVTADFSELDSLKLKKGQSATVTLNAESDSKFNATVLSVSSLPVSGGSANSAVQYAATLQLQGDTSKLRTGLSASISVVTGEADNALYVPAAALAGTGSTRTATVVHPDGSTERVDVTVGIEGDSTVQVVDGLSAGDKVQLISTTAGSGNGFPSGGFPGLGGGGLGGGRQGGGGGGGFGGSLGGGGNAGGSKG